MNLCVKQLPSFSSQAAFDQNPVKSQWFIPGKCKNCTYPVPGSIEFALSPNDLVYVAVEVLHSSSGRCFTMPRERERQILSELRELRRVESRLQSSFERLPSAGIEARASFLFSLAEWRSRARQLESLLDALDTV